MEKSKFIACKNYAKLILYHFAFPGALHQARFMASCLYILKIALLGPNVKLTARQRKEINVLAKFVAILYGPYFLKSSLTTSAPRADRDFIKDLIDYQVMS